MRVGHDGTIGADALIEAAEAWRQAGQLADARAAFREAVAVAEADHDAAALVLAAVGLGGIWVYEQRDVVERATLEAIWQRARAAAPTPLLAARLAVRTAAEATYEGGSVDAVRDAAESVRNLGDDAALAEALSLLHHVQLGPAQARSRLAMAEDIIRLGARAGDQLMALMGLCWRTVDLFLLGDPRAGQSLEELRERSGAAGCEAISFIADVLVAMTLARRGRLEDAEKTAAAALTRGTAAGDPDALAYYGAMLAALRWWQGRAGEVIDLVRTVSASPRLGPDDEVYVAADALLSATLGDLDSAEEALARLTAAGLGARPDSSAWLTTQLLATEAAFVLGDGEVAAAAGSLVRPFADLPVMPSLAIVCLGSAERAVGLADATTGELDSAASHLAAALRSDRRLGSRPMAVLTEHTLAGVLRARGGEGDRAQADALAQRASERAARFGMALPAIPSWLAGVRGASRSKPLPVRRASLQPVEGGWRLEVEQRATVLPDRVGIAYLAVLVADPGRDHDVLRLAAGVTPLNRSAPDAILDERAVRSYRRRAQELRSLLADPGIGPAAAKQHRSELAALSSSLRSALALGGRIRGFPTDRERARTAVRKALTRGVAAIAAVEPELAAHLQTSLVTGATCRYAPTDTWVVTAGR